MRIAIVATDQQWEEWPAGVKNTEWVRVADGNAFEAINDADAFINLKESQLYPGYGGLKRPVMINAVTTTLSALNAPANIIRINGWPGFLQRPVWEVAGKLNESALKNLGQWNKKIMNVADQPGFISARIIAMIINEAYFATGDRVSTEEEVDIAMKLGTNYPFGPFEWARAIGPANVLELLQQLYKGDNRYTPAPLLIDEVNAKRQ